MEDRRHGIVGGLIFGLVGIGILMISLVALLIAPVVVWFAWNVLDFGESIGAGDLGFWGIILLSVFLVGGAFIRIAVVSLVFLIDPDWFSKVGDADVAGADLQALDRVRDPGARRIALGRGHAQAVRVPDEPGARQLRLTPRGESRCT